MENKKIDCGNHKIIFKYYSKSIVVLPQKPSHLFSVEPTVIDMNELIKEIPDVEGLTIKDISIENIINFESIYNATNLKSAKFEMMNLKSAHFLDNIPNLERVSIQSNPLKKNVNNINFSKFETVVLDFEQGMYLDLDNIPDSVSLFFTGPFDQAPTRLKEMKMLKSKVNEIISEISKYPNLTDLEKVLFVYNYIQSNTRYRAARFKVDGEEFVDNEILSNGSEWTSVFNPYGTLIKKEALCNGIESTIHLILNRPEVNIRCEHVGGYSEGMQHIWNMVYIDGTPYHLDATFDILKNENKVPGIFKSQSIATNYFLVGDDEINKDRQLSNKDYSNCPQTYPREEVEKSIDKLYNFGIKFSYMERKPILPKKERNILDDMFF